MMEYGFIDQLVQQGVRHFCLAPGSRSTPLVIALAKHPQATLHVHYDERGLGFYALGIAKASSQPVVLIVTSGTAVGNLLPSLMEAHHSYIPLIILTADRPPELRDCGANQTTDQVKIFSSFVRWQIDLPCEGNVSYFRSVAIQGYFYACQNPPGPIHINCPFREPLYKPEGSLEQGRPFSLQFPRLCAPLQKSPSSKGVILVGRLPCAHDIKAILQLAKRIQWPVCADILSNARCFSTPEQIKYFDWMEKPYSAFVLHFGERMTSKHILHYLKEIRAEYIHVSPYPALQDPERLLTARVQADIGDFCAQFQAPTDPAWIALWQTRDREPEFLEGGSFTEIHALRQLSEMVPEEMGIFLGNGMPIRDADQFLFPPKSRGFFSNRGLSGIDGNIATLAGLAEEMPMLGFIGDQAALHDLNSLPLLKKAKHAAILLISNNFGGGIFHHLPVVASPYFETLFAAKHDLYFEPAAKMYNLPYFPFSALAHVLQKGQSALVELVTDRIANHQYRKSHQKEPLCLPKKC